MRAEMCTHLSALASIRSHFTVKCSGSRPFAKEKIEVVDHEKKLVTYSVIDGEILNYYKSFSPTLGVASKADGGAVVTWSVEYEKLNEVVPEAEIIKELAVQTLKELDAYLLKN
ncbi:MLP-like protein 34 [Platanthera guangdongensis]|uniref:MLP-like protein 34 n=1 Tax=Platanthera guangdongensis TaxID=2320717 RepID=A0ABR2M5F1_9ASPA